MLVRTRLMVVGAMAALGIVLGGSAAQATISALTVDPRGTLSAGGGQVTLTGTITCTSGDGVTLDGAVFERIGRLERDAINFNGVPILCTGAPQAWTMTLTTDTSQPVLPGPANADVFAFDSTDGTSTSAAVTVLLTR